MSRRRHAWIDVFAVSRVLTAVMVMVASLLLALPSADAAGVAPDAVAHPGTGRVIDVLAVGDSYMAGNGAGGYYDASPDDPSPLTGAYSGPSCYRSYNNSSYLAYSRLGSRGRYINRACSGKLTVDVLPETANLANTPIGDSIDLITYSAGGNDAAFADIIRHCFISQIVAFDQYVTTTVDGLAGDVSRNCIELVNNLQTMMPTVLQSEQNNLEQLLDAFGAAKIVVDGYPLLATKLPPSRFAARMTWNYAAGRLADLERTFADEQAQMVQKLNAEARPRGGRLTFNDVFARFNRDGVGRHSMGSSASWINGPLDLPVWMEGAHPNTQGQSDIADGVVAAVNSAGWFGAYVTPSATPVPFTFIPGSADANTQSAILADRQGNAVRVINGISGQMMNCAGLTLRLAGWVGATSGDVTLVGNGPDKLTITCAYPRAGDIVAFGSTAYLAFASTTGTPFPGTVLKPIPTGWMYNCLAAKSGVRRFQMTPFSSILAQGNPPILGQAGCVPNGWRNRVLMAPDGASWFVDSTGVRHWIPDPETFFALTGQYGGGIMVSPQVDVDTIPRGADRPPQLIASDYNGKIIRRNDGVSWAVLDGVRHHIPTYAVDLCAQYVDHRPVARTGLSGAQTSSIPEDKTTPYGCTMTRSILRANDASGQRPSYAYYDGRRHWIPDTWTFDYYARQGWPVVDVAMESEITKLPDGGTEPKRLDPAAIPGRSIIRRDDGVSWVVDGSGVRHHIPYVQDDVCWRDLNGYGVSATGLSFDQANVLPEAEEWPCIIGNRIVKSDDGSSWYVDTSNARHWIPDGETFGVLGKSYAIVGPWPAVDVNQIPRGNDLTQRIDPASVANSLICRNDGVCWAVDGSGTRHHVATYGDNVCWRWVNGWHVSRNGLNFDQAASLPEASPWGCSMGNRIIATNEGAAYWMDGGNVRHWIPDPESYYCYVDRGSPVIRGMGVGEAGGLPEGGWMAQCLSPNRVLNHIVRVSDGTAYFIDRAGWWYWIPNGSVWSCLTSRYSVLINNASWTQVNSIRRERGVWANCGM